MTRPDPRWVDHLNRLYDRVGHHVGWDVPVICRDCGDLRDRDGLDEHDCTRPPPHVEQRDPMDLDLLGTATSATHEHHERTWP